MTCLLCKADQITKWYYKDDICYVCDCLNLMKVSENLFPRSKWRGFRRKIKDHWHEHIILEN
jgi:hypothetical protein